MNNNDMGASDFCKLILYADDSLLVVYVKHIRSLKLFLEGNLWSLSNWLVDIIIYFIFGTKHMLSKHSKVIIYCGNNVIASKTII